jgi:Amt family ammonium transporter
LGLTISKQLVEKLGGTIDVASEVGIGSTFRFVIPSGPIDDVRRLDDPLAPLNEKTEPREPPETARPPDRERPQWRILVAEDSIDCQRLITFILGEAGVDVAVVNDGQAAYEAAMQAQQAGQPFDVVLMDMQMPVLDGYAATRQLREAGYTHPIIALTAHAMSCDRKRCLAAGCDDFASKPIDRARLLDIINQHASAAATAGAPS